MKSAQNPCNSTIKCGVSACTHHNKDDYCSLNQIAVEACDPTVTNAKNTECASFQLNRSQSMESSIYGQGSN